MKNIQLSINKLEDNKEIPTKLRLFKFGVNKTTKGEFVLTEDNAEKIIQNQKDYGNKLNFDYNHSQLNELMSIEDGVSAGTFDLAILDDGLYATNIEWTAKAKQLINDREYIYTSPAFDIEKVNDVKYIIDIINCALTNLPATKELKQILEAASKKAKLNKGKLTMDEEDKKKEEQLEDGEEMPETDVEDQSEEKTPMQEVMDRLAVLEEIISKLQGEKEPEEEMKKCSDGEDEEDKKEETEAKKLAKDALLDLAVAKGKIAPSQKKVLSKLSLKTLKEELETMPVVTKLSSRIVSEPVRQKTESEQLSDRLLSGYKSNFRK